MKLGHQHENWIDDTVLEFPQFWFWMIHVMGAVMLFVLGMRFAFRRAPAPIVAYRLLRTLLHR